MVAFEDEPDVPERRRVYINENDEELAIRPALSRTYSNTSHVSVKSERDRISRIQSRKDLAIPIEYRTLSYNIEDDRNKQAAKSKKDAKSTRDAKDKAASDFNDLVWHKLGTDELCKKLNVHPTDGLPASEVTARLQKYGRNVPSPPPSQLFGKIMGYLFGGFGSVLLAASILVFIAWRPLGDPNPAQANLGLAIVLLIVFVVQALFNAWQDFSSSRVMNSITGLLPQSCLVLRGCQQVQLMAPDLVPGDVVYFKAGTKLPADVRMVEVSSDARFDRSILTGESAPIPGAVDSTDDNYLETRCIGMQGTHCVSGSGIGIVVSTGDDTVFGRIAKLTSAPKSGLTPLQKEVYTFVAIIVSLMVLVNVIVLAVYGGYIKENHPDWMPPNVVVIDVVSVAVAFIPEGLPIALTATLTIIANIMRRNNILCKSLKTVETLGAISVLCSDKTGTLTKNKMTVNRAYLGGQDMSAEEVVERFEKASPEQQACDPILQLRSVAAMCNAGEFDAATVNAPLAERSIIGDATDQAILRFSESIGPVNDMRNLWRKRFELAFNSKNKFMINVSSIVEDTRKGLQSLLTPDEASSFHAENDMLMTIKGAPDVLMPRIKHMLGVDGKVVPFDDEKRAELDRVKDAWSSDGKRVILLARRVVRAEEGLSDPSSGAFEEHIMAFARDELVLVGIVGLTDPPREEIPGVCQALRGAGVRIFMVTGDFKLTAAAIARECGIISVPMEEVDDFSKLSRYPSKPKPKPDVSEKQLGSSSTLASPSSSGALVISGSELITLNETQWEALCGYREIVFARTTPDQKLRIVKEFQARGHLVGMTGDGVNDAPSLKQADIGVAPGSGSDIAIEAADMVLLDSFAAIVQAVMYGRVVFDNLKKTICYLLPAGSYSELWPIFTSVVFGLPQVLSSFLMIIICCFTDCAAATALAYEKPEADVMLRPPRHPKKDRLVDWKLLLQAYVGLGTLESLCSFSMAYWYAQRNGVPFSLLWFGYGDYGELDPDYVTSILNTSSSIYFVTLVVMQWFNLMATRTRRLSIFQHPPVFNSATQNLWLFPAILFAIITVFIFNYIPQLQSVLASAQIPVEHWFLPMTFGVGLLLLDESRKWAVRKWPQGILARIAW